jgi:hypothetical protein
MLSSLLHRCSTRPRANLVAAASSSGVHVGRRHTIAGVAHDCAKHLLPGVRFPLVLRRAQGPSRDRDAVDAFFAVRWERDAEQL